MTGNIFLMTFLRSMSEISFSLFKQPTTDDASHDEALSNRIAALNLLDLGLGHLGIDVGDVSESDLHVVVKACGDSKSSTFSHAAIRIDQRFVY